MLPPLSFPVDGVNSFFSYCCHCEFGQGLLVVRDSVDVPAYVILSGNLMVLRSCLLVIMLSVTGTRIFTMTLHVGCHHDDVVDIIQLYSYVPK